MSVALQPFDTIEVDTCEGRVRGFWRDIPGAVTRSAAFLGIPFAQAPVGSLRFSAPVPMEPWVGVRDVLEYGATAQRGDTGVTLIPEPSVPGESTLNVNVFTPDPSHRTDPMPVLVWIHGGGFISGSPASPWYDGRAFNRDSVVTVSLGYRLGFEGFGAIRGAGSNRGVRDWIAGLEWVQRNISAFGGDPSRVTIAGQSAGGGAVLTLLGMEHAQHLFHSVYCASGAIADVTPERGAEAAEKLAKAVGVEATVEGFSNVEEESLLAAQGEALKLGASDLTAGLPFGPLVDGELIVRPTPESLRMGVGSDKSLVLGATDDEFSMIVQGKEKFLRWLPLALLLRPFKLPAEVRRAYLRANPEVAARGHGAVLGRLITDNMFRTVVVRVARARGEAPTWVYRVAFKSKEHGAAVHCIDVPFLFDCLDGPLVERLTGENPPQELADAIHGAAVAFMREGDPGWTPWSSEPDTDAVFGGADATMEVERGGYGGALPLLEPAR